MRHVEYVIQELPSSTTLSLNYIGGHAVFVVAGVDVDIVSNTA